MNNLQHLYETDLAFADIVDEAAAAAIGSTSASFAGEWLKLEREPAEGANGTAERLSAPPDARTGAPAPTVDSRAALEADVHAWLGSWTAFSVPLKTVEDAVLGWLDRQAAITAEEVRVYINREDSALIQGKIDQLESERDYWKLHTDCWADKCKEVESERDELRDKLSAAIGHAHATCALVDLEGNVV